jgi:hypothetical protein
MPPETTEERLTRLESKVQEMEERLTVQQTPPPAKRGWRAAVGIDANNPNVEGTVRLARQWRFVDSPEEA